MDEIIDVPGLKMVYLGMGDLTKVLGHPGDDRHPEVHAAIKKIVARANSRGVVVCGAALGYKHGVELSDFVAEGVQVMWDLGVRVVLVPRPTLVMQYFYENMLGKVRDRLKKSYP